MNHTKKDQLDRMFNPRGLAFFGGIASPGAFGNLIALSQIRYGYKGSLYPISPKGGEIAGHKIYKSLDEVEGLIDLACVSVPARAVPEVLQDCLDHGVNGVQVHSSGFAETGKEEGIELQRKIIQIARQGLRIVGPNCFGLHSPKGGITVLPGSDFSKAPGSVALISQSGGVATDFGYAAQSAGMGISKVISFGNGCDVDALELMEYMGTDPETQYIAAYLEGIQDGPRFLEAVKLAAKTKPVVVWKAGLTPLGNRAAQSHTGSLAGGSAIWEGVHSVYPFIFTSDSDWTVDVCARVPSGYSIVGVYDENGDLIPSAECIQTFINGESKGVAFEVQEIGSPEPYLDATLNIETPKGKKVKKKIKTYDIRKKTFKAKLKEAKDKIKKAK